MASYFFRNTGDTNWGLASNWSLTSGGGATGAVPTNTDDATLDANSGNVVTNTSARVCKTLTATNFTGTLTLTNTLSVSGNITLGSGMTLAGSASLVAFATGTLTSNGKTVNTNLNLTAQGGTLTLADNWTVTGTLTVGNNASTPTLTGNTVNIGGNLVAAGRSAGTTLLNIDGTGTWSGTGQIQNNLTINTAGTLTLSGTIEHNTGVLTYTAGTISAGTSTIQLGRIASTISCGGMTGSNAFANISIIGNATVTLTGNLECSGNMTGSSSGVVLTGNYTFTIMGNLDMSSSAVNSITSTTTKIVMGGTGFIKGPTTTGQIRIDLTINTSGTITIFGTVNFSTQTFKYTAGTIGTSGTPILKFLTAAVTCTLNANFVFAGTIQTSVNTVFNGTDGFQISNFLCNTAGVSNTFAAGETYTVTNDLTLTGTAASNVVFVSGTPTSSYNFVVSPGATQDVGFVNATDADSSAGQTIWDYKGTLLRTVNWNLLGVPRTVAYTFVS